MEGESPAGSGGGGGRAVVEAQRLSVSRGGQEILHSLDMSIEPGTITGLLGPSGCGKTTLMRTLVGVQHYSGRVRVLGHAPGARAARGRVGYVAQGLAVYRDLTARQNVRYFAALAGDRARGIEEVLTLVGLGAIADRPVAGYSGGQAGRVSLACALVANPDLLVMDEPTVGLDPVTREELWDSFRAMAQAGAALLVSSHVMDEAFRCDRVLLMRQGRILATTTADDLLASTGQETLDAAFLCVIQRGDSPDGSAEREAEKKKEGER
ncbi:ABC transporter ATP-binding protein [Actinomyces bowdenii]